MGGEIPNFSKLLVQSQLSICLELAALEMLKVACLGPFSQLRLSDCLEMTKLLVCKNTKISYIPPGRSRQMSAWLLSSTQQFYLMWYVIQYQSLIMGDYQIWKKRNEKPNKKAT
jgi:hypothetical protein